MTEETYGLADVVLLLAKIDEETITEPISVTFERPVGHGSAFDDAPSIKIMTIKVKMTSPEELKKQKKRGLRAQLLQYEAAVAAIKEEMAEEGQ